MEFKNTGIVRRIDDLGRIIIPKEIRRILRIKDGDPMTLFYDENGVYFKKYSVVKDIAPLAKECAESLTISLKNPVLITDKETIVASGSISEGYFLRAKLSNKICEIIDDKKLFFANKCKKPIAIMEDGEAYSTIIVCPILVFGEVIGSIISFTREDVNFGVNETNLIEFVSLFLKKQLESD